MGLRTAESIVRWAGLAALLTLGAFIFPQLWRGRHRSRGRAVGRPIVGVGRSRSLVVAVTLVYFGGLYLMWRPLQIACKLSPVGRFMALLGGSALFFPGLALAAWGRLSLGEMYDVSTSFGVQLHADQRLITSGPYSLVRHPMYLGLLLSSLGALFIYRTWAALFVVVSFLGLPLRAKKEEEALSAQFGPRWTDYSRRVPAWFPRLRHHA